MAHPSSKVRDTFRKKPAGLVEAEFNDKPYCDNYHMDRSRLGTHSEWDPEAENEWGGKGATVEVPNNVRLNAMSAMGDICAKSSNVNPPAPSSDTGAGPHYIPASYPPYSRNPMFKKKG